jgi:hypothetical protein
MGLTLLYVLFIVIGLRFFSPEEVGIALFVLAAPWFLYVIVRNDFRSALVPMTATAVGFLVWMLDSAMVFKVLPVLISALFFVKFTDAVLQEKPFLAAMVRKVPKVAWTDAKLAFIDNSHGYWMVVTGINLLLQIVVLFAPLSVWALYTTLGWYMLFGTALAAQIIYGKVRGV